MFTDISVNFISVPAGVKATFIPQEFQTLILGEKFITYALIDNLPRVKTIRMMSSKMSWFFSFEMGTLLTNIIEQKWDLGIV